MLKGRSRVAWIVGAVCNRFEAVTVMLQGELEHRDSMGNKGLLRAGDVQRLTAGSGVVHDEGPSPNMKKLGGTIESFQVTLSPPRTLTSPTRSSAFAHARAHACSAH
jgi:redox-sensitive bicupin YhaK (pirin superfamily)